ncbi:MAG: glutamate--tRNA ligase [Magnetococcales bacterium]|nr:glutamate--tRNA ligase [Magnetococcales bacterium]
MTTRTRFAPSPTGFLHIGGARTALFCYLFARHTGGTYILRVEDTDRERSTHEAVAVILQGLEWLGLKPDEGPFFQSDATDLHRQTALQLVAAGKAYRCSCTREELDAMREEQRLRQEKPRYDGRCRERTDPPSDDRPYVIRLKTPRDGEVVWDDMIQGRIRVSNGELDDLILLRSDGSPTYNLAVVVDDHHMGITHVIRGEDHVSNTPRQIHIFEALGWTPPAYAHMPLLHGTDGAKLSKRHGAVSVLQYRDNGYLPEAVNNYLVRLGWSHGDQEIFTMVEMVALFDVHHVGRSAAIFNVSKLDWINGQHIRSAAPEVLLPELIAHLERQGIAHPDPALVRALLPTVRERAKTMVEMADKSRFYFQAPQTYDDKAVRKHLRPEILDPFAALVAALTALSAWDATALEAAFKSVIADHDLKMGQLAQPVRVAITGSDVSPSIFDVLAILGRDAALARLNACLDFFRGRCVSEGQG